jgi:hypothetical protein
MLLPNFYGAESIVTVRKAGRIEGKREIGME